EGRGHSEGARRSHYFRHARGKRGEGSNPQLCCVCRPEGPNWEVSEDPSSDALCFRGASVLSSGAGGTCVQDGYWNCWFEHLLRSLLSRADSSAGVAGRRAHCLYLREPWSAAEVLCGVLFEPGYGKRCLPRLR